MLPKLILLFVITPLAELAILVYVGTLIGVFYTILIVVATGIIGALVARNQGLMTISRIRSSIEQGIMPSDHLFEGVLILVGALFLLTPGIITDILGFILLIPHTRRPVAGWLQSFIQRRLRKVEIRYREER
ncbi:FxsA family protein [Chloroflexota bacterium]